MRIKTSNSIIVVLLLALIGLAGLFSCGSTNAGEEATNIPDQQTIPDTAINQPGDNPPVVDNIISEWTAVERGKTTKIKIIAHDPDGDKLTYTWRCTRGSISGKGAEIIYSAPTGYIDDNPITVYVSDGRGGGKIAQINVRVVCCANAQKNPDWVP
jgi:hypothetical protein